MIPDQEGGPRSLSGPGVTALFTKKIRLASELRHTPGERLVSIPSESLVEFGVGLWLLYAGKTERLTVAGTSGGAWTFAMDEDRRPKPVRFLEKAKGAVSVDVAKRDVGRMLEFLLRWRIGTMPLDHLHLAGVETERETDLTLVHGPVETRTGASRPYRVDCGIVETESDILVEATWKQFENLLLAVVLLSRGWIGRVALFDSSSSGQVVLGCPPIADASEFAVDARAISAFRERLAEAYLSGEIWGASFGLDGVRNGAPLSMDLSVRPEPDGMRPERPPKRP